MPETTYVCAIGGERLHRDDAFYCECGSHEAEQWYCRDEMRQCDHCNQYYIEEHWPDPCCEDPDDEDDDEDDSIAHILQSYSYKPDWVFSRQSDENTNIYLGVELEFEAHSTGDIGKLVAKTSTERVLWKADGSLIRGAELVTHPASLRYHLEEFDWNGLLEQVADADLYVAPSCGMHIHASRPSQLPTDEPLDDDAHRLREGTMRSVASTPARSGSVGSMELSRLGDLQTGDAK